MIRFVDPMVLWWWVPVLGGLLLLRSIAPRVRGRRASLSLVLRGVALALLIAAVARPQVIDQVEDLAVAFVVDVSRSVPSEDRDAALRQIQADMEQMPATDRAALVVFGDRPSVELPFGGPRATDIAEGMTARLDHLESRVDRNASDLARAIEFASGVLPRDVARRIVLVSDGNQTQGDLRARARELRASGVRLDARAIRYAFENEVMVEELHAAPRGRIDEPLQLRAVISSESACEATLELRLDGELFGDPYPVRLDRGTNIFRFSPTMRNAGIHQFELSVRSEVDGNQSNNIGRAGVVVAGNASAWVVSPVDQPDRIASVLREGGMGVRAVEPSELPADPSGYFLVDSVVLNNVPAFDLSAQQIGALRDAVQELGVGLVVVGGDRSYAPGGYRGTPIADLLPVDLDTSNKKTMPKGALVIILHSIEFDSGNTWAVRICNAAIGGMNPTDEAGIVILGDSGGAQWLFDLQPIGDRAMMSRMIEQVYPGDMQTFEDCFQLAVASLGKSDAAVKHVVIISDGDPQGPSPMLLRQLQADQVTISTVCIEPHGPGSEAAMKSLALQGNGNFYRLYPSRGDLQKLPSLMLKEAATLRRASLSEEPFVPSVLLPGSSMLRGIGGEMPQLLGYCITSIRGGAETILLANDEQDDPLLAAWHSGLGRVVAFTSDLGPRWAKQWLPWERFGPLVQQMVRASVLDFDESAFPVEVVAKGMQLRVAMTAKDGEGIPFTDLSVVGSVLAGGADPVAITLRQQEAGIYTGVADVTNPGHYAVQLRFEQNGRPARVLTASAIDYAPEFRAQKSREDVLQAAAEDTGGRLLSAEDDPFEHDFEAVVGRVDLWPWILMFAAGFLVLDVASRRLDLFGVEFRRRWADRRAERMAARAEKEAASAALRQGEVPAPVAAAESTQGPPEAEASVGRGLPETAPKDVTSAEKPSAKNTTTEKRTLDELKRAKKRGQGRREWK